MGFSATIIKDQDRGWTKLLRSVRGLKADPTDGLEIGWIAPELAQRAAWNELGTDTIPERPFVRPTIDGKQQRYLEMMEQGLERVALEGGSRSTALVPAANAIRSDLINAIITLRTPENAPSTVDKKGTDNPLVDTGEMQRGIQIRDAKGGRNG
jgi:hypothetical protein